MKLENFRAEAIGAIGALMNRVHQPRTLVVLGLNAGMGTAAGADELVEIPTDAERPHRTKAHPLHLSTSLEQKRSQVEQDESANNLRINPGPRVVHC